jgi:hypothetical protein
MLNLVGEVEQIEPGEADGQEPFPAEVEFILSAMEAAPKPVHDRRALKRTSYRVRATLRLFSDALDSPPALLYTRNVNPQTIGFLTECRLPLSHGGVIRLPGPDGKAMEAYCTILRCREAAPGWYEGAVYFNRRQHCFAAGDVQEEPA